MISFLYVGGCMERLQGFFLNKHFQKIPAIHTPGYLINSLLQGGFSLALRSASPPDLGKKSK
jgi:hypothetical protein